MKKIGVSLFAILLLMLISCSKNAEFSNGSLIINVSGIKDVEGPIFYGIYESGPISPETTILRGELKRNGSTAKATIEGLEKKMYGVLVFHDTNYNIAFDVDHESGQPLEGFALSRLKERALADFSEISFLLDQPKKSIRMKMFY